MDRGIPNHQIEVSATYMARPSSWISLDTVAAVKAVRNGSDKIMNLAKTNLRR